MHSLEETAKFSAGNWQSFSDFGWYRLSDLEDPEHWAIFYSSNRDSGLLEQSNESVINKKLEEFTGGDDPDIVFETHNHWAVGHVNGFSIRVFDRKRRITPAFKTYYELLEQLDDYPVLDEEDYSRRELEATLKNIENEAYTLKNDYILPEDWISDVYSWLSENDCCEVENTDDKGGYPSEAALQKAFQGLKYPEAA